MSLNTTIQQLRPRRSFSSTNIFSRPRLKRDGIIGTASSQSIKLSGEPEGRLHEQCDIRQKLIADNMSGHNEVLAEGPSGMAGDVQQLIATSSSNAKLWRRKIWETSSSQKKSDQDALNAKMKGWRRKENVAILPQPLNHHEVEESILREEMQDADCGAGDGNRESTQNTDVSKTVWRRREAKVKVDPTLKRHQVQNEATMTAGCKSSTHDQLSVCEVALTKQGGGIVDDNSRDHSDTLMKTIWRKKENGNQVRTPELMAVGNPMEAEKVGKLNKEAMPSEGCKAQDYDISAKDDMKAIGDEPTEHGGISTTVWRRREAKVVEDPALKPDQVQVEATMTAGCKSSTHDQLFDVALMKQGAIVHDNSRDHSDTLMKTVWRKKENGCQVNNTELMASGIPAIEAMEAEKVGKLNKEAMPSVGCKSQDYDISTKDDIKAIGDETTEHGGISMKIWRRRDAAQMNLESKVDEEVCNTVANHPNALAEEKVFMSINKKELQKMGNKYQVKSNMKSAATGILAPSVRFISVASVSVVGATSLKELHHGFATMHGEDSSIQTKIWRKKSNGDLVEQISGQKKPLDNVVEQKMSNEIRDEGKLVNVMLNEKVNTNGECSVQIDLQSSQEKMYKGSVEVDAHLIQLFSGRGEKTKLKIENEFKVTLDIPSNKNARKGRVITIQASSEEAVRNAIMKIEQALEEELIGARFPYSHFISLPLAVYPKLVDEIMGFQEAVLASHSISSNGSCDEHSTNDENHAKDNDTQLERQPKVEVALKEVQSSSVQPKVEVALKEVQSSSIQERQPKVEVALKEVQSSSIQDGQCDVKVIIQEARPAVDFGIEKSIFIKPETIHLTVLMLKLWSEERINLAVEVLKSILPDIHSALEGRPVSVSLRGLECMRGQVTKAHVLYAMVHETDKGERLLRACQVIIDAYVEAGLVSANDIDQDLNLHMTIMNTSHRKSKRRNHRRPFDATKIIADHGSREWGDYEILEAHLSQRFSFDENGYYHCCCSIPFPKRS